VLLPVPQPDGDLGTMNLEDIGNLRGCFTLHVEGHRVKPAGHPVGTIPKGLFAEIDQALYLSGCSMKFDRSHGTSF